MARAHGARAQMALAFETVYGTAPATGYRTVPFASTTLGSEQPLIVSELLGQGRDPLAPIKDAVTADGDVVVPIDVENFGLWLKAAFGQPTTTGTTPKTHTFQSGKTEEAYKFYASTGAQPLREDVRRNFPFGGILFEEYSGTVTLSTKATERLVPANDGIAFPLGTMDTFTTYGGPANLLETANTIGLPLYARQHLDEKGRWIDVMTEASILPVNKRPRLAIRLHTSN